MELRPPLQLDVVGIKKEVFEPPSIKVANFTYIYIYIYIYICLCVSVYMQFSFQDVRAFALIFNVHL